VSFASFVDRLLLLGGRRVSDVVLCLFCAFAPLRETLLQFLRQFFAPVAPLRETLFQFLRQFFAPLRETSFAVLGGLRGRRLPSSEAKGVSAFFLFRNQRPSGNTQLICPVPELAK
jgi:hypothetical protein